jgi:hypothetical protein
MVLTDGMGDGECHRECDDRAVPRLVSGQTPHWRDQLEGGCARPERPPLCNQAQCFRHLDGKSPEAAAVEDHWGYVGFGMNALDTQQHDVVIAGSDLSVYQALQPQRSTVHEDGAAFRSFPCDRLEPVRPFGSQCPRNFMMIMR